MNPFPHEPDETDDDDPEFVGRFELDTDGVFEADIFQNATDDIEDLHPNLDEILLLLGIDTHEQEDLLDLLTQRAPDVETNFGFDPNADNSRGGYTRDEVLEFLNETGWWGIADIYYDEELDEYYIDINYE